jgi:hypothetical protein
MIVAGADPAAEPAWFLARIRTLPNTIDQGIRSTDAVTHVDRHGRGTAGKLRRRPPAAAGARLAADLVRLADADAGAPEGLIGIHTNLLVTALAKPGPAETQEERAAADQLATSTSTGKRAW